jgi:hypothetical protein
MFNTAEAARKLIIDYNFPLLAEAMPMRHMYGS